MEEFLTLCLSLEIPRSALFIVGWNIEQVNLFSDPYLHIWASHIAQLNDLFGFNEVGYSTIIVNTTKK